MTYDETASTPGSGYGDQPPARPPRHLRVGILLSQRSATVESIWLVDQPAVGRPTFAEPILVRVDVAGRTVAVAAHADPRLSRSTMRPRLGHSFGTAEQGTLFVSVPFTMAADLAGVRIRLTDLTGVALPDRSPAALARLLDDPVPGMRAIHEVTSADLRAARDWAGVAGQIGIPADEGRFEIYAEDSDDEGYPGSAGQARRYRWRLRRSDGQIVAASGRGYDTRQECEADLAWVRAHAGTAPVTSTDVQPPRPPG